MPLLTVPDEVPFIAVTKAVFAARAASSAERLERAFETQRRLTAAAASGRGLRPDPEGVDGATGIGVAVTDPLGRLIAESGQDAADLLDSGADLIQRVAARGMHGSGSSIVGTAHVEVQPLGARRLRGLLMLTGSHGADDAAAGLGPGLAALPRTRTTPPGRRARARAPIRPAGAAAGRGLRRAGPGRAGRGRAGRRRRTRSGGQTRERGRGGGGGPGARRTGRAGQDHGRGDRGRRRRRSRRAGGPQPVRAGLPRGHRAARRAGVGRLVDPAGQKPPGDEQADRAARGGAGEPLQPTAAGTGRPPGAAGLRRRHARSARPRRSQRKPGGDPGRPGWTPAVPGTRPAACSGCTATPYATGSTRRCGSPDATSTTRATDSTSGWPPAPGRPHATRPDRNPGHREQARGRHIPDHEQGELRLGDRLRTCSNRSGSAPHRSIAAQNSARGTLPSRLTSVCRTSDSQKVL